MFEVGIVGRVAAFNQGYIPCGGTTLTLSFSPLLSHRHLYPIAAAERGGVSSLVLSTGTPAHHTSFLCRLGSVPEWSFQRFHVMLAFYQRQSSM